MKFVFAIVASLIGLILIAILCVFYALKHYTGSLNLVSLADSTQRIPTIPMMDPDSFEAAEKPRKVGTRVGAAERTAC